MAVRGCNSSEEMGLMPDDHYVQQKFMKGFLDSKGALYFCDKESGRSYYPAYPPRVLFEKDYETTSWAEVLHTIERSGMEGIELIRARQYGQITTPILEGLLIYLLAHINRSPHHLRARGAATALEREFVFHDQLQKNILGAGQVLFRLAEFRGTAAPLYLTDNLVSKLFMGEGKMMVTFPVSSHQIITGVYPSPEADEGVLRWSSDPMRCPDYLADNINARLFNAAGRFVLGAAKIVVPPGR
jgi:hypothetical protein